MLTVSQGRLTPCGAARETRQSRSGIFISPALLWLADPNRESTEAALRNRDIEPRPKETEKDTKQRVLLFEGDEVKEIEKQRRRPRTRCSCRR